MWYFHFLVIRSLVGKIRFNFDIAKNPFYPSFWFYFKSWLSGSTEHPPPLLFFSNYLRHWKKKFLSSGQILSIVLLEQTMTREFPLGYSTLFDQVIGWLRKKLLPVTFCLLLFTFFYFLLNIVTIYRRGFRVNQVSRDD